MKNMDEYFANDDRFYIDDVYDQTVRRIVAEAEQYFALKVLYQIYDISEYGPKHPIIQQIAKISGTAIDTLENESFTKKVNVALKKTLREKIKEL